MERTAVITYRCLGYCYDAYVIHIFTLDVIVLHWRVKVHESSIDLLNDASSEYTMGVKLHFQLRLKAKDFDSVMDLHDAAQV